MSKVMEKKKELDECFSFRGLTEQLLVEMGAVEMEPSFGKREGTQKRPEEWCLKLWRGDRRRKKDMENKRKTHTLECTRNQLGTRKKRQTKRATSALFRI